MNWLTVKLILNTLSLRYVRRSDNCNVFAAHIIFILSFTPFTG